MKPRTMMKMSCVDMPWGRPIGDAFDVDGARTLYLEFDGGSAGPIIACAPEGEVFRHLREVKSEVTEEGLFQLTVTVGTRNDRA